MLSLRGIPIGALIGLIFTALFLIAAIHNTRGAGTRVYGVLIAIAALCGVLISARHIWIQAQPPGTVAACGADLNYLLDIMPLTQVVTKVLTGSGECGTIDWTFYSVEWDVPKETYTLWARAGYQATTGKCWWDDLKFEVLGDSQAARKPTAAKTAPRKR